MEIRIFFIKRCWHTEEVCYNKSVKRGGTKNEVRSQTERKLHERVCHLRRSRRPERPPAETVRHSRQSRDYLPVRGIFCVPQGMLWAARRRIWRADFGIGVALRSFRFGKPKAKIFKNFPEKGLQSLRGCAILYTVREVQYGTVHSMAKRSVSSKFPPVFGCVRPAGKPGVAFSGRSRDHYQCVIWSPATAEFRSGHTAEIYSQKPVAKAGRGEIPYWLFKKMCYNFIRKVGNGNV